MIPPFFRRSVSLKNRINLPTNPGVYYLIQWFRPRKILYIGKADNLRSRWSGKGHHHLERAMKKPGIRIHYRTTWTKGQARELEAIEQQKYNPPWNDRVESLSIFSGFIREVVGWFISIPISIALYWGLLQYWETQQKVNCFKTVQVANLREKPTVRSKTICKIEKGMILKTQDSSEWRSVRACGTVGYVNKSNLETYGTTISRNFQHVSRSPDRCPQI